VQPLVVVFEDLHWHDSESQALLDSLVESLPMAQLLLLVNYRPEYSHNWGDKTYYTQLRLDPFPPESSDEFLEALLGNDASLASLKKLLIQRTEGNPFFLEESVRTLVETQVLTGEPGAYRLAQDLPSIQVPPTVQAVLAARIDRLPEDEKRLLQTASVIGNEVPFTLFQAIAEISEEALHPCLTHLQAAEFLYETSLFPERVYTFKHALTHEVAYGSLLQERRRVLHARIVAALESLGGDGVAEQVERLAYHALRGELWDKALVYYRQAGTKALALSAYREAVMYFTQALAALARLPKCRDRLVQAIDLRLDLRQAFFALGEYGPMLDALREADTLATALGDHRRLGQVATYMSQYFWATADQERALVSGQRALALAETLGDVAHQAIANLYMSQAYNALGNHQRAIECLRTSVALLEGDLLQERLGLPYLPSVFSRTCLAGFLGEVGAFAEGMAIAEEGVRIAEAVDPPLSRIAAYVGVGVVSFLKGDLHQVISVFERSLALSQSLNIPVWPIIHSVLGAAYALSGRIAEALPLLEQAVEHANTMHLIANQALWLTQLSEAYLLAGRLDDAHSRAGQALEFARGHKGHGQEAYALRLLGEVTARREPPDIDQAITLYRQALALANELGMRPLQAHCHRGLGTLYRQTGQAEQACAELSIAIEMYRDMEMMFWLPETEAALAEVEGKA
jgi:tetratricopeptide (TPR) repeat protein